jgi:hypothetical protein
MTLTKETVQDKVEVLEDGTIQVRTVTRVVEDGNVIGQSFHRHVIAPGQDLTNESGKAREVAETVHTTEVIAAYQAKVNG